ncbi:MAG TPA: hypothetical protein PK036_13750 [Geobacteraceae bacterium]|nr:hypothetical protein [Geobacteraceae bacterium]
MSDKIDILPPGNSRCLGGKSIAVTRSFFTALALISGAAIAGIAVMSCFRKKQPATTRETITSSVPP